MTNVFWKILLLGHLGGVVKYLKMKAFPQWN